MILKLCTWACNSISWIQELLCTIYKWFADVKYFWSISVVLVTMEAWETAKYVHTNHPRGLRWLSNTAYICHNYNLYSKSPLLHLPYHFDMTQWSNLSVSTKFLPMLLYNITSFMHCFAKMYESIVIQKLKVAVNDLNSIQYNFNSYNIFSIP